MLLTNLDRGGAEAVAREHAGDPSAFVDGHHGQIAAVGLADPGHRDAETDARHGMQISGIRRLKIYGHSKRLN